MNNNAGHLGRSLAWLAPLVRSSASSPAAIRKNGPPIPGLLYGLAYVDKLAQALGAEEQDLRVPILLSHTYLNKTNYMVALRDILTLSKTLNSSV